MAMIYTTRQGEMIDAICRRFYGDESGYVEAVVERNPGLANHPALLPVGVRIVLPDLAGASEVLAIVNLWD